MKNITRLAFIVFLFAFTNIPSKHINVQKQPIEPSFLDNGKTVDSLKKIYSCKAITYENWGDKKAIDSCLTVCLINSSNVPAGNGLKDINQLKNIAAAIKKALTNPRNYKSIYIIFIKKEIVNGMEMRSHITGMEVSISEI